MNEKRKVTLKNQPVRSPRPSRRETSSPAREQLAPLTPLRRVGSEQTDKPQPAKEFSRSRSDNTVFSHKSVSDQKKSVSAQTNTRNRQSAGSVIKKWMMVVLAMLTLMVGSTVGIAVGLINHYLDQLPEIPYLEDYQPWMPSRLFSGDAGKTLIADFFNPKQNRDYVPLTEIPENLINAIIAMEDVEFYSHPGFSVKGFLRAAYANYRAKTIVQGGSTLTIQLAEDLIKNKYLPYDLPDVGLRSYEQKLREIMLALQIEKRFTKDEILEFYLNQIFLGGNNITGVARAAEFYFGKEISDLTLKECAVFAAMLKAPNAYSPVENPEAAQKRTELVLRVMHQRGFITKEQCEQAIQEPLRVNTETKRRRQVDLYPYFSWAIQRQFKDHQFVSTNGEPIEIYGQGIDIETTLDTRLQEAAEQALRKGIVDHERRRRENWGRDWGLPSYRGVNRNGPSTLQHNQEYDAKIVKDYDPETGSIQVTFLNITRGEGPYIVPVDLENTWLDDFGLLKKGYFIRVKAIADENGFQFRLVHERYVQGGIVVVRPSTGEVLAMAGGYDYYDNQNAGQFIRTIQATMRQPGSAIKPILYAAALAEPNAKRTVATFLEDKEKEYWPGWAPKNFEGQFFGRVTMRFALLHSLNAASVWLLDNFKETRGSGIQYFRRFCRDVFELNIQDSNLSIALGTSGTSPMELAQAYSVLANRGNYVKLHMVNRIHQRKNARQNYPHLLYEFNQPYSTQMRLSPQVAYLTTYLMRQVVEEGTGKPALELPFYSVGKTGTTDNCTNAWYAGYSNDILCIVYLGFDDPQRSLGAKMTGSKVALPVWMDFMRRAYDIYPELFGEIQPPSGIVFKNICEKSGKLAVQQCVPVKMPFIEKTAPVDECPIHRQDSNRSYQSEFNNVILSNQVY